MKQRLYLRGFTREALSLAWRAAPTAWPLPSRASSSSQDNPVSQQQKRDREDEENQEEGKPSKRGEREEQLEEEFRDSKREGDNLENEGSNRRRFNPEQGTKREAEDNLEDEPDNLRQRVDAVNVDDLHVPDPVWGDVDYDTNTGEERDANLVKKARRRS